VIISVEDVCMLDTLCDTSVLHASLILGSQEKVRCLPVLPGAAGCSGGAPYSWETLFPLIECAARQIICVPTVLFPQFTVGIGALVSVTDAHSPSLAITLYMVSTIKRKERMRQGP
jgi:hypothetical protein